MPLLAPQSTPTPRSNLGLRQDADTAYAARAAMLEAQAAEGLEATRRDAEVRARARADVARAEARLAEVEQKLTATRKGGRSGAGGASTFARRAHARERAGQT